MEQRIAVFFDAENISSVKVPLIINCLSSKGDILFQRAYADWSIGSTKSWKNELNKTPITAIQQFHHGEDQAVDKLIMMDAIEMAIKHEEIDIFAIVASDNGYHSLALRLRELGKRVIGLGEKKKCSAIWVKSCNEFLYLEDLEESDEDVLYDESEEGNEIASDANLKDYSLEKFLEQCYDSTSKYRDTNTVLLSRLWETVYRRRPDFNVKEFGAASSRELIKKLNNLFILTDDGKPQRTFFVEKIEKTEQPSENLRIFGIVKRRIKNYRIISAEDGSGDYFFYMGEINPEFKNNRLEKETRVSFQVVNAPSNNGGFENKNGRATDVKVEE